MTSLYWFCQAVLYGGFAAASQHNRISAPTLSRAVAQLEESLGEKLIHRHAKQFRMTAAGEDCYQRFSPLFETLEHQWGQLANVKTELSGDIHVSCPEPFADGFLQAAALEFMGCHPGVRIHITLTSDTANFVDDRLDLAIATNPSPSPHLIQRQLFDMKLALAASPEYLASSRSLTNVEQLSDHSLLAGNSIRYWEFLQEDKSTRVPVHPRYSIDSLRLVIQAACAGMGICLLPQALLDPLVRQGKLCPILPEIECATGVVYLVWADRYLISNRVSAFRDMVLRRMRDPKPFMASLEKALLR
ncbi:LysR family transcriptional regulator [Cobetia sp. 1CM21F]|uniref:LysR family transcriptional regulator n=1 Tax=Cobetia sp. 1CM21F TaxID=2929163 RepID=UPI0020C12296|nr:LysR family transcriptional regulator [Cobetia sp. 1CM21F]MCK8067694.1 LysR family transcriptional regulator [Cobetia sp. 1CM21F]